MPPETRAGYPEIAERASLGDNLYRITIAANVKARNSPYQLAISGIDLENYMKNPTVLWAHDSMGKTPSAGLPVARTLRLTRPSRNKLVADFEFLSDDPFAQRVKNAWDKDFLRAASVSWSPTETEPVDGGEFLDTKSELLEWSIVAVPADPDALRDTQRRMMDEFLTTDRTKPSPDPSPVEMLPVLEGLDEDDVRTIVREILDEQKEGDKNVMSEAMKEALATAKTFRDTLKGERSDD